ncbi:hypothetical protein C8Q76DRAFT_798197 [Earliella scabrosa]|nr:hypothetical protein C8Q76DRAFT_798197 [Earliella scabrosa]
MSDQQSREIPRKRSRSVRAPRVAQERPEDLLEAAEVTEQRPRRVRIHSPTPSALSPSLPVGEQRPPSEGGMQHSPTLDCAADLSRLELTREVTLPARSSRNPPRVEPEPSWTVLPVAGSRGASPPIGPVGEVVVEDTIPDGGLDREHTSPPPRVADLPRTPDRFAGLPSPGPVGEWTPRAVHPSAAASGDTPRTEPDPARRLSFTQLNSERSPSPLDNHRLSPLVLDETAGKAARDHALQALSLSQTLLSELAEERETLAELRQTRPDLEKGM